MRNKQLWFTVRLQSTGNVQISDVNKSKILIH